MATQTAEVENGGEARLRLKRMMPLIWQWATYHVENGGEARLRLKQKVRCTSVATLIVENGGEARLRLKRRGTTSSQ